MVACVLIPLARCITQRKSPPRLDGRPPTSVHVAMPAPTTLSELIALYLARCRIEGLSPRTQRAYSETLARFQRSVAAQGVPDAAAAVETATVIRYCETFQARRPATRHRYFREVRCFFNWCVAAGFLDHTPFRGLRNVRLPSEVVQLWGAIIPNEANPDSDHSGSNIVALQGARRADDPLRAASSTSTTPTSLPRRKSGRRWKRSLRRQGSTPSSRCHSRSGSTVVDAAGVTRAALDAPLGGLARAVRRSISLEGGSSL